MTGSETFLDERLRAEGARIRFKLPEGPHHHEPVTAFATYGKSFAPRRMARCPVCNALHSWADAEHEPHTCCGHELPSPWGSAI